MMAMAVSGNNGSGDMKLLEETRMELLKEKQKVRRAAWKEEVKKEMEARAEIKRRVEAIPLEQVKDRKDKEAMSKMSLEWREAMKDGRTSFLSKAVFPILFGINGWEKEVIKGCRKIGKDWKQSIDQLLSKTRDAADWNPHWDGGFVLCNTPQVIQRLRCLDDIQVFNLFWSKDISKNPFFSRKLFLGYGEPVEWKDNLEYWEEMEKLLRRWGKELRLAVISFDAGMSFGEMYELLIRYLSLMPNLQELHIFDELDDLDPENGLTSMKELISRKPLPELLQLRTLLYTRKTVPDPLIRAALATYGKSLESLILCGWKLDPWDLLTECSLPSLKYSSFVSPFRTPRSISRNDFLSLEEVSMEYPMLKGREAVAEIFRTLSSSASALKKLRLIMRFAVPREDLANGTNHFGPGSSLELPHLESLYLNVRGTNLRNIDFLLQLVSLKELVIDFDRFEFIGCNVNSRSEETILQFCGYEDRGYQSNIWNLLPELKLFHLNTSISVTRKVGGREHMSFFQKRVVYTRDGYRQYCTSRN